MNFFIDGSRKELHDYPDYLDSIIGMIPDLLLLQVVSATPEYNPTDLILHFRFKDIPGRYTCRINKQEWRKNHDLLNHFAEQVTRIAKIASGEASVVDLMNLDMEITSELKEWVSTENQRRYHEPLVRAPKRNPMPIGYDQDFTTW